MQLRVAKLAEAIRSILEKQPSKVARCARAPYWRHSA